MGDNFFESIDASGQKLADKLFYCQPFMVGFLGCYINKKRKLLEYKISPNFKHFVVFGPIKIIVPEILYFCFGFEGNENII